MWKLIRRLILLVLVVALGIIGMISYKGYELYKTTMDGKDLEAVFETYQSAEIYTSIDRIPTTFINAIIAVEDHRFLEHEGFDIVSVGRAIIRNVSENEYAAGGSTITQQLSKNLFFSFDKKMERKVAELIVARQIEKTFDKNEILEMYINIIYFGDGYEGITNASMGYFNKLPSEMTKAESILISGLPQAPSAYALREHFDRALTRGEAVIDAMIEYGYLLPTEKKALLAEIKQIKIQVN